jgi:RNA polymerase sigma-70 factor, ECF subfamily
MPVEHLLALESGLARLEAISPRGAEVVILRFFSGLSVPEVAEHLGISARSVESDWTYARAWLRRELAGAND